MKKIMVVDDTEDTVELTKAVLEMNGFEVMSFLSPKDALTELDKGVIPDLLIIDIRMPEMSGPEVCKCIRADERFKDLKIVLFTASSDINTALLKEYNLLGYIFKPFDNDKLVNDVKKFLVS